MDFLRFSKRIFERFLRFSASRENIKKHTTMRTISEIIIHCSATPEGKPFTIADIDQWHRQRGFRCIGYHFVIYLDGSVHAGRPIAESGAHCHGHNAHSIGICYVGGLDSLGQPKDTRTPAQKTSLVKLVNQLKNEYPNAKVHGHNEYANKACPCFDVQEEFHKTRKT